MYDPFKWADDADEEEIRQYEEGWKEYYRSKEYELIKKDFRTY